MSDKQITKKQHYVPRFYLKRFANKDGNVQRMNMKLLKIIKPRRYSAVCYEKFFYGIETGIFDETSQEVETWLENFENKFGKEWDSIIKNVLECSLSINDFDTLSWFLSLQMMRTKKFKEVMHKNLEHIEKTILKKQVSLLNFENKEFINEIEKNIDEKISKEDFNAGIKILLGDDYSLNYNNVTFLNHLIKNSEGIRNILFLQKWTIIKSSKNFNFITTDNPVVEWIPKRTDFWGPTILEKKHYLPLTPEILIELKLSSVEKDILPTKSVEYVQATDDEVMMYNFLISDHAHSFTYSSNKKELIELKEATITHKKPLKLYWANYANK